MSTSNMKNMEAGKITLISSDAKEFKVDTWLLRAGSKFFRDLLDTAGETTEPINIDFPATVVTQYLALMDTESPLPPASTPLDDIVPVLKMADKYESRTVSGRFLLFVHQDIVITPRHAWKLFLLACTETDIGLAREAIRSFGEKEQKWMDEPWTSERIRGLNARGLLALHNAIAIDLKRHWGGLRSDSFENMANNFKFV